MANFKTRVEGLTNLDIGGTAVTTNDQLSDFLKEGIYDLVSKIKVVAPSEYRRFASKSDVGNDGARVDGEVLLVTGTAVGGYERPATEVEASMAGVIADSNSIHYQSAYHPVFYREGKDLFIKPNGGTVLHIPNFVISHDSEEVFSVPEQYYNAIAIYAAIRAIHLELAELSDNQPVYEKAASLPEVSFTAVPPIDLNVPQIGFVPSEMESVTNGVTIDRASIDAQAPVYIPPVMESVTIGTFEDIELPDSPSVPAALQTVFDFDPSVDLPVYNKPVIALEPFPDIETLDINALGAPPAAPPFPNITAESVSDLSVGALPTAPTYTSPKLFGVVEELMENEPAVTGTSDLDILATGAKNMEELLESCYSYLIEEEDPELASAITNFISTVVNLYSTQMSDNLNTYNSNAALFQAEVQKVMQQFTADRSKLDKETDLKTQATLNQYQQEIASWGQELARYQALVNSTVQEWQHNNVSIKLAQWNGERANALSLYGSDMSNEMNKFNEMDKKYQAKIQKATQDMAADAANNSSNFSAFDKEMALYTAEVNTKVQEYTQNVLTKVWEQYKFDKQQALSTFQAEQADQMNKFQEESAKFQAELTIAQANASNSQAALTAQMQTDTELAKNNSMQLYQASLNQFQQELAEWQARLSKYQQVVGIENNEYSQKLAKFGQDMTNNMNDFNTKYQVWQGQYQWLTARMKQLELEYIQGIAGSAPPQQGE
jgi:hypothetical protein